MRIAINYIIYAFVVLITFMCSGCNDDIDYKEGSKTDPNSPGVYFVNVEKPSIEIDSQISSSAIMLLLERINIQNAISVPVLTIYTSKGLIIPSKIDFETNQKQAELIIEYTDELEKNTPHDFKIEIAPEYTRPYDMNTGGATTFKGIVTLFGSWEEFAVANVKFINKTSKETPVFGNFKQKIYKRGTNQYKIENFLLNNDNYDFYFKTDVNKQILPFDNCGYHNTENIRWYFYKGSDEISANRIPCYPPASEETPEGDYMTYLYFYALGNKKADFDFDESTRTARMYGYSHYRKSSSGEFLLEFVW